MVALACAVRKVSQGDIAQPVQPVAGLVLSAGSRDHRQLGVGLGVKKEEEPVEESQGLGGQL